MTMYLLLLMCTAAMAACAVWLYRSVSRWRIGDARVVSLSSDSVRYNARRQQGFIGNARRADGSAVWTLKRKKTAKKVDRKAASRIRSARSRDKQILKPWGW